MGILDNIKNQIKEYKSFRESKDISSLTNANSSKRNLFEFLKLKNFERKFSDTIFKNFNIRADIEVYKKLFDIFGKKEFIRALSIEDANPDSISEFLLNKFEGIKSFSEISTDRDMNIYLKTIDSSRDFYKSTGLYLSEIENGILPNYYCRKSLGNKTVISILAENNVTKENLKELFEIYGKEIISEYASDDYLRNASVLVNATGKYKDIISVGGLQDHITNYTEEDFYKIYQKYLNKENLQESEKAIVIGIITKMSDLIGTYTLPHLMNHPDYIKSEISVGVFSDIVLKNKDYTNNERKTLAILGGVWNKDDLSKYNNLNLLKQRLLSLPKSAELEETIQKIDKIIDIPLSEVLDDNEQILDFMNTAYMDYEIENRNNIVENVYDPEINDGDIVITDLSQIGSSAMLHFFNAERSMTTFDNYVADIEEKRTKELGYEYKFSEEEKKDMKLQYKAKENHYITDYSLDFEGIGQIGTFDTQYVTNTSNQLCALIAKPENILKKIGIRGKLALGFSKRTLNPELITTISDHNIHSNKGIDYVESLNDFEKFSASYDELISEQKDYKDNTEIVLFRNTYNSSLKASYVMYIADNELSSQNEKENIKEIKKQMKEAGINVPLVIFDSYTIEKKLKTNNIDERTSEGEIR